MQAFYSAAFDREVGCTEAEWLMWLPAAIGSCPWKRDGSQALVEIEGGRLTLSWLVMEPRQIALIRLPRLAAAFRFVGVPEGRRQAFMKRFDLYMQRGGG